jgi:hypothetical protein
LPLEIKVTGEMDVDQQAQTLQNWAKQFSLHCPFRLSITCSWVDDDQFLTFGLLASTRALIGASHIRIHHHNVVVAASPNVLLVTKTIDLDLVEGFNIKTAYFIIDVLLLI